MRRIVATALAIAAPCVACLPAMADDRSVEYDARVMSYVVPASKVDAVEAMARLQAAGSRFDAKDPVLPDGIADRATSRHLVASLAGRLTMGSRLAPGISAGDASTGIRLGVGKQDDGIVHVSLSLRDAGGNETLSYDAQIGRGQYGFRLEGRGDQSTGDVTYTLVSVLVGDHADVARLFEDEPGSMFVGCRNGVAMYRKASESFDHGVYDDLSRRMCADVY